MVTIGIGELGGDGGFFGGMTEGKLCANFVHGGGVFAFEFFEPAALLFFAEFFNDLAGAGGFEEFGAGGGEGLFEGGEFLHGEDDAHVEVSDEAFFVGDVLHVE